MIQFILVIVLFALLKQNMDLSKQIDKLKKEKEEKKDNEIIYCPSCGYNLKDKKDPIKNNSPNLSNNKTITPIQQKYTDKEIKNSTILIVGSILILLSSIIYLTTTWNITHNIFKTFIIVLMLLIFIISSNIADKIFHLKQTSKAFYLIALAYLPILFLSISIFSLLGDFLSIYGQGKNIYLSICSFITTIIYYYNYKLKNIKLISIMTMIFTIITIVITTLIFTNNIITILLILSIYLIIITILYNNNTIFLYKELHLKTISTLFYTLTILTIYYILIDLINSTTQQQNILLDISMLYNSYLYFNKIDKKTSLYNDLLPILIISIFYHSTKLFDNFIIKQILILISFIILYIHNIIIHKTIKPTTYITISISTIALYISTKLNTTNQIPTFLILATISILSLIHHIYKEENIKYPIYCFNIYILLTITDIISTTNLPIVTLGYISLIMILSSIPIKDKIIKQSLLIVGNISFNLITIINYNINIITLILYIFYIITNIYLFYNKKQDQYKITTYIYSNIILIYILKLLNINNINILLLSIPIATIIQVLLEYTIKELNNKTNNNYILIQFIISFIILNTITTTITNFILLIILIIIYILYINKNKLNTNYLYIPYLALIPYIYLKDIHLNFNIMYITSFIIISIICTQIYYKKTNTFIILFYIFTLFHIQNFNESKYISLIIFTIGTIIIYLIKENKVKDIFKGILYTCILVLFNFITTDLKLNNYTIFVYGPYLIWIPFITRTILKKYEEKNYKTWEYLSYILINYLSLTNYTSQMDGILYVFLLTIIVIISYTLKLGPIFIISIIAILINVLLLTRLFWLSIPWWIYILIIGSILISFAIYNELNDKKQKINIIDNIKNKLNL